MRTGLSRSRSRAGSASRRNASNTSLHFRGIFAEHLEVLGERRSLVYGHPAANAPVDGARLVLGEVDVVRQVQQTEHLFEVVLRQPHPSGAERVLVFDASQLARDSVRRQHEVDGARRDRCVRHLLELRAVILSERDPRL